MRMKSFHPNTSALDPELLKTPFDVQTNWHVLTGAACTGKTTLLGLLSTKGFLVLRESARDYFEAELARGQTIEQIHIDNFNLQSKITDLQIKYEQQLIPEQEVFLDRALPDSIAFFRYWGMDTSPILRKCFHFRYRTIFLLERLPLHRDDTLGPEDDGSSSFLNDWLERDYTALGYQVVHVPGVPPKERVDFILRTISNQSA